MLGKVLNARLCSQIYIETLLQIILLQQLCRQIFNLPLICLVIGYFVGNNAKGRISRRLFQENKARQISQKTSTFKPPIRTCFVILKHAFLDSHLCFITDDFK